MSLNVREIEAHEFAMVKRGYDPEEVRSYLRKVATSVKDAPGRAYGDVGDRVASVFESADKAANEIKETAEREAEAMRREVDAYVTEQRARADIALREAEELAAAKVPMPMRITTTSAAKPIITRRSRGPKPIA